MIRGLDVIASPITPTIFPHAEYVLVGFCLTVI